MKRIAKSARLAAVATALLLVFAMLAACGGSGGGGAVKVTDMMGREVSLDKPAEKVVALAAADCEILYALGAGKTLVGRGEYCNYPAEVTEVASVQSGFETNIEQIIALQPQVVLMATMNQTVEQVEALENAGITVVTIEAKSIEDTYAAIELIGAVVGKSTEAADLVKSMKADFEAIAAKVSESNNKPTVYFEVSPLEWGLWAAGGNTFMDEIATLLNMENIFSDLDNWAEVSEEQVIDRDPDFIVTTAMYYGEGPTPVEEIMGRSGWDGIAAIMQNQVFNADNDAITRPGPRLVEAAQALYDFVYGA